MIMIGIGDFDIVDESKPIFKEIKSGKVRWGRTCMKKTSFLKVPKPELALLVESLQKNA